MSKTSRQPIKGVQDRTERVQRWTAALLTVLFHALLILLVMPPPPQISTSAPQGEADGGRMNVTLIDESPSPQPPEPEPVRKPVSPKKPQAPRAIKRRVPTPIVQAVVPMPPAAPDTSETPTVPPAQVPEPPDAPRDTADAARPAHVWGQPPGMRSNDTASANAALAAKLGSNRARSNAPPPVGPAMGVDGFQVYYDLVDETRLRAWRKQGMTELFLPMPGTRRLMVCPLEVALRRGSGECRMVEWDSPQLKAIGDARDVINVQRVYQLGDVVWSGPGAYR